MTVLAATTLKVKRIMPYPGLVTSAASTQVEEA